LEDPQVEASIAQVKELIGIWQEYSTLLLAAFDKEQALPEDAMNRFDKVKRVVAQRHDQFSSVITKDHYVAQNILQMVKRTISIADFEKASEVAIDKTLIEWHEANILLYETLGSLEWRKHQFGKVTESEHKRKVAGQERQAKINKLYENRALFASIKWIFIVGLIAGFWFSPLRQMVIEIPFVHNRIDDFRDIFGMEPLDGEVEEDLDGEGE